MAERFVSDRVATLSMSAIKEMAMRSARVEGAASLAWGLPSFETPEYIRRGVIERLAGDPDIGKYALPDGLRSFRQAVARRHLDETGVAVDADDHVMITAGNMQGMHSILQVITNPGDEIILTDPCFASHIQQVRMAGGEPVFWPLDEAHEWSLDVARLEALISDKTRAVVIVSPSNPTGKIFSEHKLRRIGALAQRHDFLILIDDPYSLFQYENREKYFNLASEPVLFDQIVYLYSFSKSYAMSGWRLGYMVLPSMLKQQVMKVHDLNMICTPRISQLAGLVALQGEARHLSEFEAVLARRRDLVCERLDRMGQVFDYHRPEGAYYVFPRIVTEHKDAFDFCLKLLDQGRVTLTPGSAFGPGGEHHVRMAYCVSDDTINLAFDRMEDYFGKG